MTDTQYARTTLPTIARLALRCALAIAALSAAAQIHAATAVAADSAVAALTVNAANARPAAPRAVNLKGATASDDVRLVADWIVGGDRQKGRPFIIADKINGLLYAFDGNGELIAKTRALYGAVRTDSMTREQADKTLDKLSPADMITPAGIFEAKGYMSPTYGPSIRFAEFAYSNLLIHRPPAEWRRKYLQSDKSDRNRVTFGCINVLPEFLDKVLLPVFSGSSTIFVMPETQSARTFFAIDDAGGRQLRTAAK